jgi:hypothetical protein
MQPKMTPSDSLSPFLSPSIFSYPPLA